MFAHFTNMYEKRAGKGPAAENYSAIGFDSASSAGCMDPDECTALALNDCVPLPSTL